FTSKLLADASDLEHDAARLDVGNPPLRRTLTRTHAGFGGLLGQRTVRVDVDPHLSTTLDVTGHRNTSCLDLTVGHVCGSDGLDAELAKHDLGATAGLAATAWTVLLTVFDLTRDQHYADAP